MVSLTPARAAAADSTRDRKVTAQAVILAIGFDALAAGMLILGPPGVFLWVVAGVLHVLAAGGPWFDTRLCASRRALLSALSLTLPVVGAPMAALVLATRGRGDIGQFFVPDVPVPQTITAAAVSRLTDGLSASEALASGPADERGATLAMLIRRADAVSIRLLRWAVSGQDAELAVQAALALDDLSTQFEVRAAACRAVLETRPDFESALAAADTLAEVIQTGLVDPSLVAPLTAEARRCYLQAESFAPERLSELAVRWAHLELAVLCPAEAVAVLDRAAATGGGATLAALRATAAGASRRTRPTLRLVRAER